MSNPKVSICIPVYNSANYLTAAVESALAQRYDSFEVLIVDDCSTDGSADIAAGFAERSSSVRFVTNVTNIGMVPNWNRCLELARGEYIKFLFGDDLLSSPHNIERLAGILDRNQNVTLACSFRNFIDPNGNIMAERGFTPTGRPVSGLRAIRDCLTAAQNYIGEPSVVMFRKQQAQRGFNNDYRQTVDLEMWFHLLLQGDIWCERESLAAFRRHPEQQTVRNAGELVHLEEALRLYDAYLHASGLRFPRLLEAALYYVQWYRVWKGYRHQGVLSREQAEQIISRYIPVKRFTRLIPLYKALNPLWKLVLSIRLRVKR
ncbi:MAG: glycosyltransferase family 2 protein [Geobacteraceae bacterium]|nr:glycosyltransferase family 2 protein [Geobacteraceae bacterium]